MIRTWRSVLACLCALSLLFVPSASADMRGVDVSNWQCDVDTFALDADFVVAGATWGVGGFNNMCLTNGVNQAANYQLGRAVDSGKSIGVYHYAMGRDANAEADFFLDNVRGYVGNAVLVLDWESQDNPQFGNGAWIETCMTVHRCGRLSMFRRQRWGSLPHMCVSIAGCGLHSTRL